LAEGEEKRKGLGGGSVLEENGGNGRFGLSATGKDSYTLGSHDHSHVAFFQLIKRKEIPRSPPFRGSTVSSSAQETTWGPAAEKSPAKPILEMREREKGEKKIAAVAKRKKGCHASGR